jgi:predicted Zn finger-like uncharacterized protein
MPIPFSCPHCAAAYKAKDDLAGKKVECKKCRKVMTVPTATPARLEDSHALEALATAALGEVERREAEAAPPVDSQIRVECEYCFETVEFPPEKAGKKSPCPSCRRIVTVPVPKTDQPKKDWRAVGHNLTMALKNTQAAPQDAWGNQEKAVVSREALREAAVLVDRKKLAQRDWTKPLMALGLLALFGSGAGLWWMRGKAADDRRMGLMADAVAATGPKAKANLPPAWAAAVHVAAGQFYTREADLKQAMRQLQSARGAARQVESAVDRAAVLRSVASAQSGLIGDGDRIAAGRALDWDDARRELRQTLQAFKELPREDGWQVIEDLARELGTTGPDKPLLLGLSGDALPGETDRADALASVALALHGRPEAAQPFFEEAQRVYTTASGGAVLPRYVALLVARKQPAIARQILPEPGAEEPSLNQRLAYSEGLARTGEPADLERAKKIAGSAGSVDHRVAAWAMIADATGQAAELEAAAKFAAEWGQKFTLPAWPVIRLAEACRRAGRADLVRQLADAIRQPNLKPWLELTALRTTLAGDGATVDVSAVERIGDRTAAQAFGWVALARFDARTGKPDPRAAVASWPVEAARSLGFAGAALGLQAHP